MKLRQLEAFKAVMETGTVSSAATRLNCTQPAISLAIGALDDELGFTLFDRARGRLTPNAEAELLYQEVEQALLGLERFASVAHEISRGGAGRIQIAADGAPSINFLPRMIAGFLRERSDVSVQLHTRSSAQIIASVAGRRVDVGIVEMPVHAPDVVYETFSQTCRCIMPEHHPLARKAVIRPGDIAGTPLIYVLDNHLVSRQLDEAFANAGVPHNARVGGHFFATRRNPVRYGAGVAIVDGFNGEDGLGDGIVSRPFEPTVHYELAIVYPAKRRPSRLVLAFLETLRAAIEPYRLH